jgi:multisubunit Na+/H+ antiporter MnhE subunit
MEKITRIFEKTLIFFVWLFAFVVLLFFSYSLKNKVVLMGAIMGVVNYFVLTKIKTKTKNKFLFSLIMLLLYAMFPFTCIVGMMSSVLK